MLFRRYRKKTTPDKTVTGFKKLDISGVSLSTSDINLTQTFKCTAEEFFRVLTIPEMVQAFTHGPCKLEPKAGGSFEMFGGNVSGKFVQLVPNKLVEQTWRFKQWPDGHFSTVVFKIEEQEDSTLVKVKQSGIPINDLERTKDGWNHYYWESIKKTFGFGAMLL